MNWWTDSIEDSFQFGSLNSESGEPVKLCEINDVFFNVSQTYFCIIKVSLLQSECYVRLLLAIRCTESIQTDALKSLGEKSFGFQSCVEKT